jgi:AcrR family transcriptional regulator
VAGRSPHQLPSGRHGLSRTEVSENQRERLLSAVVQVARRTGYSGLTVREVIAAAGVSRKTFYELFEGKDDVFLAAYDRVVGRLADGVTAATARGRTWPEQVSLGLETLLERLASDPAVAHLCVVEVLVAGPPALTRRAAALEAFRTFLEPGYDHAPEGVEPPALAAETAIGGVYEVIYGYVLQNRTEHLPSVHADLLYIVLLPFLGLRRAAAEAERARATAAARADGDPPRTRGT